MRNLRGSRVTPSGLSPDFVWRQTYPPNDCRRQRCAGHEILRTPRDFNDPANHADDDSSDGSNIAAIVGGKFKISLAS